MTSLEKRPHYGLLDTVRGICILSMVAYHGMYDLVDIFAFPAPWYDQWPGYLWQQSICAGLSSFFPACAGSFPDTT